MAQDTHIADPIVGRRIHPVPVENAAARVPEILPQKRDEAVGLVATALAAVENRRLFVLLPFGVIAGLIIYVSAGSEPDPAVIVAFGAGLATMLGFGLGRIRLLRLSMALTSIWIGFALLPLHAAISGTSMLWRDAYGSYEMKIDEIISEIDGVSRVIVSNLTPLVDSKPLPIRRARVFIRNGPVVAPGEVISAKLRLYRVPGPVIPGGFDAQFHAYFDGIGAYGTAIGEITLLSHPDLSTPDGLIHGVRSTIAARIDQALPQPSAGIARAIINGDQSAVTEEAREVMATAGLAHVLSISGLHLTLVAGGVYAVLRLMLALAGARLPVKKIAALGGISTALLYYSISGGNVAALRSTIMIMLVFGAVLAGRQALTMRNVAIAALLVIASDPASVFRPSFQLSFAAVVALVGAYERTRPRADTPQRGFTMRMLIYFAGIGGTSLVAGAATLLFSVYHFQQTSPLGLIGNMVSLPLVGFVMMPAALIAVLLMPLGFEYWPLRVVGWSVDRMIDLAGFVASLSGGIDASPLLTPVALIVGLVALGWFAFWPNRIRLLGPLLAIPAVLLSSLDRPPDVLVADSTQAVAMRGENGLALVTGRAGSFAVDIWSETYGEQIAEGGSAACDGVGCFAESPLGFALAVITDPSGFAEDCPLVDLVVARRTVPSYCDTLVIDGDRLDREGVQWLAWNAARGEFDIRPAITGLNRPWRAAPQ